MRPLPGNQTFLICPLEIQKRLKNGTEYRDLGGDYFGRRPSKPKANGLVAHLVKLGYSVQIQPVAEAA